MDYRADALGCFLEPFSSEQISTYRIGMPVPAHHPHVLPSLTHPVDHPASERAGPARYKDLVRVHCQPLSIMVACSKPLLLLRGRDAITMASLPTSTLLVARKTTGFASGVRAGRRSCGC
jgi:hypothetical protein